MKNLKVIFLVFIGMLCKSLLMAQIGYVIPSNSKIFKTPRLTINHLPSGVIWPERADRSASLQINDDKFSEEDVGLLYSGGLWSVTRDGNDIRIGGSDYSCHISSDWVSGPMIEDGGINGEWSQQFNQIWEIRNEDIIAFVNDINDNGILDDPIAHDLLAWPGKDNPNSLALNGFELPASMNLAPFIDFNNDGIYNPYDFDMPFVKGAALAHWWIFNDVTLFNNAGATDDNMNLEIQCLAYSYDSEMSENSIVYYDLNFDNKSGKEIDEFRTSLWLDMDIGCPSDDYFGSSPENNLTFFYNRDEYDGSVDCELFNLPSFENDIPLVGVKMLEGIKDKDGNSLKMTGLSSAGNYTPGNPIPGCLFFGEANVSTLNYMRLKSRWCDGVPITFGGSGYDPYSTDTTTFLYSGRPDDPNSWSLPNIAPEGWELASVLMNSGPGNISQGGSNMLSFALLVTGPVEHPTPDISPLVELGEIAENRYLNPPAIAKIELPQKRVGIWPIPTNDILHINVSEKIKIKNMDLINFGGQIIQSWKQVETSSFQINVEDYSKGMYLLKLTLDNDETSAKRIVIN